MSAAAVLVFRQLGPAYHALHLSGLQEGLEVLELIPMGRQAQLIIKGPEAAIIKVVQQLSLPDFMSFTLLPNWNTRVEKAFYSLEHTGPKGPLIFYESESLGQLFQVAHEALGENLEIVDLKIPRGPASLGILILTGAEIKGPFLAKLQVSTGKVTYIQQPSAVLKSYFEIEVSVPAKGSSPT